MAESSWYREFFGEDYLRLYRVSRHLDPELTAQQVDGIIRLLNLPTGSSILDLACGHGRHAIPLAERGYRVTGLDLSEVFLDRARTEAAAKGVNVRWVRSDMREIPFEEEFDAVINIFSSFGYLEREGEDQKVLEAVARALRRGGVFLVEMIHRDALLRRYLPYTIARHDDGLLVLEEHELDFLAGRNRVHITMIEPDGGRKEYRHAMRLYTLRELVLMLEPAGLSVEATYGGLDGSRLTLESRRLVVQSRKPG